MAKIYEWKCPDCSKVIESIYEEQFKYNKEQHQNSHKKEANKNA